MKHSRLFRTSKPVIGVLSLCAASLVCTLARGATFVWDGGALNNLMQNGLNWVGDVAPGAGSDLTFAGAVRLNPSNDFGAGTSFGNILFQSGGGAFTIGGNQIALNGTEIRNSSASAQSFLNPFNISGTVSLTTDGGSGLMQLRGGISGSGGFLVQAGGTGIYLNTANSYSGVTTIDSGKLTIFNNSSLGSTAGGTVVNTGGTLQISNGLTVAEPVSLDGGTLTNVIGNSTYTGDVTVNASSKISTLANTGSLDITGDVGLVGSAGGTTLEFATVSTNPITVTGVISSSSGSGTVAGLLKTGAGSLTLDGANTYAGDTTVNGGTLILGADDVLPDTTNVVLNGSKLVVGGAFTETAGGLTVTGNTIIDMAAGVSAVLSFVSGNTASWSGILKIYNWDQGLWAVGSGDRIHFDGFSGSNYFSGSQVQFYSDAGSSKVGSGAFITPSGFLVAVPEPGAVATVGVLLGLISMRGRRGAERSRQAVVLS